MPAATAAAHVAAATEVATAAADVPGSAEVRA
ncbi:MAG: hypothetical protein JWR43_2286, partial [Phenylobacterium sp.]|nr:hypothetical protein [Phenylobacterium sp.]